MELRLVWQSPVSVDFLAFNSIAKSVEGCWNNVVKNGWAKGFCMSNNFPSTTKCFKERWQLAKYFLLVLHHDSSAKSGLIARALSTITCCPVCLCGEDRIRLDLEYPVYGARPRAPRRGSFYLRGCPHRQFSLWIWQGRDLNPRLSLQGKLIECNEINHWSTSPSKAISRKSWILISHGSGQVCGRKVASTSCLSHSIHEWFHLKASPRLVLIECTEIIELTTDV